MKTVTMNELAKTFGVEAPKPAHIRNKVCKKCGGIMTNVPGTNLFVCQGNPGKPCDNTTLSAAM